MPKSLELVARILADDDFDSLNQFAAAICEAFGFRDPRGSLQLSTCMAALRDLDRRQLFDLPWPAAQYMGDLQTKTQSEPVPPTMGVPARVDKVEGLKLVLVESEEHRDIWNRLIEHEHPRGLGMMGRSLRYLIDSNHGWLGALGFASSARHLRDRDKWIGWDAELRKKHLDRVVGLSRLLIRPCVSCKNLASHVLGKAVKQLKKDFWRKYKFEVFLVETFVEPHRSEQLNAKKKGQLHRNGGRPSSEKSMAYQSGVSFRAANWVHVGKTSGRGRQDQSNAWKESRKDIYMYVLRSDFRDQLGLDWKLSPLDIGEGLDAEQWAQNEFGGADVGDKRRLKPLIGMAVAKGEKPDCSWPVAAKGDRQTLRSFYRFIDQPDDSAVTMEGILLGHKKRTMRRMASQRVVLCVEDSTYLKYPTLLACEGLGFLGKNESKTSGKGQGLRLHSMLTLTTEGTPLGLLWQECVAREERKKEHKGKDFRQIPIEEKETYRWVQGLNAAIDVSDKMPDTVLMVIVDREGDFFELFAARRNHPGVQLLVRAKHDRRDKQHDLLFERVRQTPKRGVIRITVPRQSKRRKRGKQSARKKKPQREACLEVRYSPCEIMPPTFGVSKDKPPEQAWIIHVVESNPPAGEDPVEWYLLTTAPITSMKDAVRFVGFYGKRWRIEDWHHVLKSGCKVESLAHHTAERLKRSIAIAMVVSFRIMQMMLMGREYPNLRSDILFSDLELEVLEDWSKKNAIKISGKPVDVMQLSNAVHVVSKMGGYLGRKCDDSPGPIVLHRGLKELCVRTDDRMLRRELRPAEEPGGV